MIINRFKGRYGMSYLPVFLNLSNRACLIVGGGRAACDAAAKLLQANAQVTVAAPQLDAELRKWVDRGSVRHYAGCFSPRLLDGKALVVAATDNRLSNRWVSDHAGRRRIPVRVLDDPEVGDVILANTVGAVPLADTQLA